MPDEAAIRARARELGPWFHNLDLGGVKTAPEHFLGDYPAVKWRRFAHALPADLHGPMVGTIRADHFLLEPAEPHRVCTPASVAAHSLYEREDPYLQPGPGGVNDLSQTVFSQETERVVRVAGSRWLPDPVYRVKLGS